MALQTVLASQHEWNPPVLFPMLGPGALSNETTGGDVSGFLPSATWSS